MTLAVDSSVAAKWLLDEEHAAEARRLLERRQQLLAPQLLWAELASVLWKRSRRGEIGAASLPGLLAIADRAPLRVLDHRPLVDHALAFAQELQHPPCDCLYLAVAEIGRCPLVTADRRLHDRVTRSAFAGLTLWVADVP